MLTIEELKKLGADTDDGLQRCMNDEGFYLGLVKTVLEDESGFEKLKTAVREGDLDSGFEAAHSLKGLYANLSLSNLFEPVSEMTEELRARNDIDYSGYISRIEEILAAYRALL